MTKKTTTTHAFNFNKGKLICPDGRVYDITEMEITVPLIEHESHGRVVGVERDPHGVTVIQCWFDLPFAPSPSPSLTETSPASPATPASG